MLAFRFRLIIILLLTLCTKVTNAQSLLWRISGNGLHSPSYLFGTMHLTDKRLFNFDDSVYAAIKKAEGLAIELNPDEVAAYYVNKMFDEKEKEKALDDLFTEQELRRFKKALAKKFKKPTSEITAKDVIQEKNKWVEHYLKNGQMPTFVDAYLYNLARKQGKWVGGIEDLADQMGIMDELIDKSDIELIVVDDKELQKENNTGDLLEEMIRKYAAQDIQGIDSMLHHMDSSSRDLLLIKRNIKMARRMDSLAHIRTMFFAVGTAHLPDETGVIELLRKKGFTVEPVIAHTKTHAEDYKFKEVPATWFKTTEENGLYSVMMPGNATSVKLYGLLEMKFLLDIFNASGYCTTSVIRKGVSDNPDQVFKEIIDRILKGKDEFRSKKINTTDGSYVKEYSGKNGGLNYRLRLAAKDDVLYMAWCFSSKKESLDKKDIEKFFDSFTIIGKPVATDAMYTFTDSVMAVTLHSPAKLTYNDKMTQNAESGDSWKATFFSGMEASSGSYVMLISKEVRSGYYIPDDTAVLNEMYQNLRLRYSKLEKKDSLWKGYHAMTLTGHDATNNLQILVFSFVRGNKNLVLMAVTDQEHANTPPLKELFSSLQLLPYQYTSWQNYTPTDKLFSTWAPAPFTKRVSAKSFIRQQQTQYLSFDTATTTTYAVTIDTLDKYTSAETESLFWKEKTDALVEKTDSVISVKEINRNNVSGREMLIHTQNTSIYQRVSLLLSGNVFFTQYTSGEKDVILNDNTKKFFGDFTINVKIPPFNITLPRTKLILQDLKNSDSAIRAEAYKAISDASFKNNDLDLLHAALLEKYHPLFKWDTDSTMAIQRIAGIISRLNNQSSVNFVKTNYPHLTKERPQMKAVLLDILAQMKTTESYKALTDLLITDAPDPSDLYLVRYHMKDSLALLQQVMPTLLTRTTDTAIGPTIADFLLVLKDSNLVNLKDYKIHESSFITLSHNICLHLQTNNNDDFDYGILSLEKLLEAYHSNESYTALERFTAVPNKYISKEGIILLLKNDQAIDSVYLKRLAAEDEFRKPLYDEMKEIRKEHLFPKQYLTQKAFASSVIYQASYDYDEEYPEKIVYLSDANRIFKGKKYKFYLYKVSFKSDDEPVAYLGIAGGYDMMGKTFLAAPDISGLYWDEDYDEASVTEFLDNFIAAKEKEEEEKEQD